MKASISDILDLVYQDKTVRIPVADRDEARAIRSSLHTYNTRLKRSLDSIGALAEQETLQCTFHSSPTNPPEYVENVLQYKHELVITTVKSEERVLQYTIVVDE